MSAQENLEHVEHAEHASHGGNKKIALLISVLALFLAFSETLGKSAQTAAITHNVTSNDLWAFYQAKHIRGTILRIGAEQLKAESDRATDPAEKARLTKTVDGWIKLADRYDDDPEGKEGRKQLAERAKQSEERRELAMSRYHHYELASASVPDRYRAGLGPGDHRHGRAGLAVGPARPDRIGLHRHRLLGTAPGAPVLGRPRPDRMSETLS